MVAETQSPTTTSWIDTPPRSPALRKYNAELIERMPWLEKVANPVQGWLHKLFGQPGEQSYKVKDMLNGVWLGHPVHPAIVTIPLGAWTATQVLDFAWLLNEDDGIARSADITLWLGLAGATGAALTGASNWVDTDGPERRTGIWHALLNSGVTVLNIGSAIMRVTGQRKTAITLSSLGLTISLYSAYLGGELAYSSAIGVNRVAPEGGSDDFVPVLDAEKLEENKLTRVDAAGIPAVLYKSNGKTYAIAATCSHLGGPLDEGRCEAGVVYCPWHNSGFRMSDGSVVNSPAVYAQPTFDVRVREGKIELRRREHA
ncbi:DUF2231 domain-containing protein [Ktedonobacter racemifer]|uniref:Rieske (2Fe-2S) iron-sulfur domain protein protein n=1 Tax=Ktedonobacter racemifer DSM 44963 TaxID=485913 RepID=D6TDU3_KTERA|nr:DUF2231 domain-containing protein [Ktedonobacter racemifer]EFH90225.1 Rieske (2Fe-2S) iron-sulfur domain protein protein [Ktedonobacter racemifer DSM 44963]